MATSPCSRTCRPQSHSDLLPPWRVCHVSPEILTLIVAIVLAAGAFYIGRTLGHQHSQLQFEEQMRAAKERNESRLLELQEEPREALREAKEESAKIRASIESEARERRQEMKRQEQRLQQKEESLDRKSETLERQERSLAQRSQELDALRAKLEALREQRLAEIQAVAHMSVDEARAELIRAVEEIAQRDATARAREIEAQAREEAESRAREIITLAIQRCAS